MLIAKLSLWRGSPRVLDWIEQMEARGVRVLNPSVGVRACRRSHVVKVMKANNLPYPPDEGSEGYWIKRADEAAQHKDDVCFCRDKAELERKRPSLPSEVSQMW